MVTKRDVAQLAGVSPATVSNFYNGKNKMSVDTQLRIIEAANQLNFSLPSHKTLKAKNKITYLVVDDLYNPHYSNILHGMSSVGFNQGYPVSMIKMGDNIDSFCSMLIENDVYAAFFTNSQNKLSDYHIEQLRSHDVFVFDPKGIFVIDQDDMLNQAISHLKDLGHKNIAYLSGISIENKFNNRYQAFCNAMERNHLTVQDELIIDGIYPYETDAKNGYWATKSFLEQNPKFTALVTLNDLLAIGALNALAEHGLSVPKDVSVIGCDNILLSEFTNPPLTTLRSPSYDMGKMAMYAIIKKERYPKKNSPVTLHTDLVVRRSTGRPPVSE